MTRRLATLMPIALLVACGDASREQAPRRAKGVESGAALEVAKLGEGPRNIVFAKAVRAAGFTACLTVTNSARAAMMDGAPGWKADCDNGSSHLIQIKADGTANVTSRSDVR